MLKMRTADAEPILPTELEEHLGEVNDPRGHEDKIAKANDLKLGMDAKACFGEMKLTESDRRQIDVAVPSAQCRTGKMLDVYDRSRAGLHHSLFAQPVCGTSISAGPKSPYGDNMITIDGQHYMEKGADFVRVK